MGPLAKMATSSMEWVSESRGTAACWRNSSLTEDKGESGGTTLGELGEKNTFDANKRFKTKHKLSSCAQVNDAPVVVIFSCATRGSPHTAGSFQELERRSPEAVAFTSGRVPPGYPGPFPYTAVVKRFPSVPLREDTPAHQENKRN